MKWIKTFETHTKCLPIKLTGEVISYINKFKTDEEFLRSGGLPTQMLQRLAFGFSSEDIKILMPKQLHIKWKQDYENVIYEQEYSKLSKKQWAEKIDLSEPIDVIYEKNKFYIDDGYHRYYAAKILGKNLNVNLEINMNPIKKISPTNYDYDNFHRCIFMQVKNTIN